MRNLIPAMLAMSLGHVCALSANAQDTTPPSDHSGMDMSHMDHAAMDMSEADMSNMSPMPGLFGTYPATREASGTSWQPDSSPMTACITWPAIGW